MSETDNPLVSVIMPVYNGERFLAEAIDSILAQTFTDYEFLIVDDGSQDRTAEIVRDFERRDRRIRFMQLERNVGKAIAKNHGNDAATGAYLTGMDSDDVSLPERLAKQVAFLQANPDIGVVGVCAPMVDADLQPLGNYDVPARHPHIAYNILMGRCVVGTSLMIRREVLNLVGGFEPSRKRGNDIEFVTRLISKTRFENLPDRLYLYRMHDGQHPRRQAKQDWAERLSSFLFSLWGEAPQAKLDRMKRVGPGVKLNWLDRRGAKRDLTRLIDSMIAAEWIEPADRPYLIGLMNRQLERTSPRLWQMFCHWRRHRFGRPESQGGD